VQFCRTPRRTCCQRLWERSSVSRQPCREDFRAPDLSELERDRGSFLSDLFRWFLAPVTWARKASGSIELMYIGPENNVSLLHDINSSGLTMTQKSSSDPKSGYHGVNLPHRRHITRDRSTHLLIAHIALPVNPRCQEVSRQHVPINLRAALEDRWRY